ncbi:MAG TPA: hypothetical protein VEA99_20180, partial [Gemmatimonadaceae bacterium]|nr:hypothetical protein [Gemmatimonadaceae bacterium]
MVDDSREAGRRPTADGQGPIEKAADVVKKAAKKAAKKVAKTAKAATGKTAKPVTKQASKQASKPATKRAAAKKAPAEGSPYAEPAAAPKPSGRRPAAGGGRPSMPIAEGHETASDRPVTRDDVHQAYAAVQQRAVHGAVPPIDPTREGRRATQRGGRRAGDKSTTIVIPAHLVEAPITAPPDPDRPVTARDVRRVYRDSLERARRPSATTPRAAPPLDRSQRGLILDGLHNGPHGVLGAHPLELEGEFGTVVRAFQPNAQRAELVVDDEAPVAMFEEGYGLFSVFLPDVALPLAYKLRFHFADGAVWERHDAYRFLPTIGEMDLHLFNEGTHRRLWDKLGAHPMEHQGVHGTSFAVWAPNARRVSVVGEFCAWDGRVYQMRNMGQSGV